MAVLAEERMAVELERVRGARCEVRGAARDEEREEQVASLITQDPSHPAPRTYPSPIPSPLFPLVRTFPDPPAKTPDALVGELGA